MASYRLTQYSWQLVRDGSVRASTRTASVPEDAARIVHEWIGDSARERFVVLILNTRNRIVAVECIGEGTLNGMMVHPREVFAQALHHTDVAAIVVGHNHPSGETNPSSEDRALTARLVQAGKVLGIEVLDHVIVGPGMGGGAYPEYYSFKEQGSLPVARVVYS